MLNIPRETGAISLEWDHGNQRYDTDSNRNSQCSTMNWPGDSQLTSLRAPWVIDASDLTGSVGELARARLGTEPLTGDVTAWIRVSGEVDMGGLACHLPLHRWGDASGSLSFDLNVTASDRGGSITCTAGSLLTYTISVDLTGVASCRDLRDDAAEQLVGVITAEAAAPTGR